MDCLRRLWSDAVAAVPFDVPSTGIGFGAVGSLARGQIGPSSDLDLVIIYEPHTINGGIPCGTAALTSISRCARGSSARP